MKVRTTSELERVFQQKIRYVAEQVKNATQKPLLSEMREEYANQIAVALRTLVTFTSSCESLAKRCGYDKKLFFPLYDPIAACSLIPQYNLVNVTWNNEKMGTFCVKDDLDDNQKVRTTYMTFDCWKSESVIDFLSNDFAPLSREQVIRIVADKLGAHVDSKIEEHLFKVETDHILPVFLEADGTVYYGDGKNLFTETVLGIAKELVFACKYTCWGRLESAGDPSYLLFAQAYETPKKYVTKKYVVSRVHINAYNANRFFPCEITESPLKRYIIPFRQRTFDVGIIGV